MFFINRSSSPRNYWTVIIGNLWVDNLQTLAWLIWQDISDIWFVSIICFTIVFNLLSCDRFYPLQKVQTGVYFLLFVDSKYFYFSWNVFHRCPLICGTHGDRLCGRFCYRYNCEFVTSYHSQRISRLYCPRIKLEVKALTWTSSKYW